MTNVVGDWFEGFATIGGFMYFLAGFGFCYAQACIRAKMRHKEVRLPWRLAGIAVGIAAMIVVTMQTQVAYTTAQETAREVQECQREFNQALQDRARIAAENDELSQIQRRILFNWIHDLIFPPEPYTSMATDDQRRQAYGFTLTTKTEHALKQSMNRQDELQVERARKPLPDPTCGK